MRGRRLEVLTQRENVDADRAEIGDRGAHFVEFLAHAENDPRLRHQAGILRS